MSLLLYRGASLLSDGGEIAAIMTGLERPSVNVQTGRMLTVWFVPTSSKPSDAVRNGDDSRVCGGCSMRPSSGGKLRCYVRHNRGPDQVWRGLAGNLIESETLGIDDACAIIKASKLGLRLGGWGDPASVRPDLISAWIQAARFHTGYTQQWRSRPDLAGLLMASVTSIDEAAEAQAMGFKTYRIADAKSPPDKSLGERWCPTVIDGVTSCKECKGCDGSKRSYCTPVHGFGKSKNSSYEDMNGGVN